MGLLIVAFTFFAVPQVRAAETVVAAMPAYFPPYYQTDGQGRPSGFGVEILDAVAHMAGVSIRYEIKATMAEALEALKSGEADLIPNLGITPRRQDFATFTPPVETFRISLFVQTGTMDVQALADLDGRKVAAARADQAMVFLKRRDTVDLLEFDTYQEGLLALLAGEVDAFAYPEPVLWRVAHDAGVANRIKVAGPPLTQVQRAIAVRRDKPVLAKRLSEAVRTFAGTEEYRHIYAKWLGMPGPSWSPHQMLGIAGGILVFAILAMAAWRSLSLARVNRQLMASEARFRGLVEGQSDLICRNRTDGTLLQVNDAYARFFGSSTDALVGVNFARFIPEGQRKAALAHLATFTSQHPSATQEHEVVDADGRVHWMQWTNTATVFDRGRPVEFVAVGRDLTERRTAEQARRESEERLKAVLDNSNAVIFLKDREGRYLMVNRQYETLFGQSDAEFRGKTDYDIFPRDFADVFRANDQRVIAENRPIETEEKAPHDDGPHTYIVVKFPVPDADGMPAAVGGIATDITEHIATEAKLREAQKMDAVGKLTGGVAHDFNNLLTVVLGNLEMLEDFVDGNTAATKRVVSASGAAQRGAQLTQRLLAFARRQPLSPEPLDCNALVEEVSDLLKLMIGERATLELALDPVPRPVTADRNQLENALLNLAANARDAMPDGGQLTVETSTETLDQDLQDGLVPGDYVRISVRDNGPGMSPEVREQAFEPFFTTKPDHDNTGLGLSMVFGFALQSGGSVAIDSEPGCGTTVHIYLPVSDDELSGERDSSLLPDVPVGGRETVLVVEDDADVRQIAVTVLAEHGYKVLEAADGKSALRVLRTVRPAPDLLFTDVVLPGGINGHELAKQACHLHPDLKVLYTTGYAESVIARDGSLNEGIQLLAKPYRREVLLTKVRHAIDG